MLQVPCELFRFHVNGIQMKTIISSGMDSDFNIFVTRNCHASFISSMPKSVSGWQSMKCLIQIQWNMIFSACCFIDISFIVTQKVYVNRTFWLDICIKMIVDNSQFHVNTLKLRPIRHIILILNYIVCTYIKYLTQSHKHDLSIFHTYRSETGVYDLQTHPLYDSPLRNKWWLVIFTILAIVLK